MASAAIELWPRCPRCGSSTFVHRAGLDYRLQYPARQKFSCTRCGKNRKFLPEDTPRYRPGRVRRTSEETAQLPTRLEIRIRPRLLPSLVAMFKVRSGHAQLPDRSALSLFLAEIIEAEIVEFRSLNPSVDVKARGRIQRQDLDVHRRRLPLAREAEIRDLRELGTSSLAKRFGVGQTTIRRVLREAGNAP